MLFRTAFGAEYIIDYKGLLVRRYVHIYLF